MLLLVVQVVRVVELAPFELVRWVVELVTVVLIRVQ